MRFAGCLVLWKCADKRIDEAARAVRRARDSLAGGGVDEHEFLFAVGQLEAIREAVGLAAGNGEPMRIDFIAIHARWRVRRGEFCTWG
jgi:hypothetical protein